MRALWISSGALVWALHFTAIYGFTALACALGFARAVPWAIGAATAVAIAAALAIVLKHFSRDFHRWMTAAVAGIAIVAIVWQALPVLLVPACG